MPVIYKTPKSMEYAQPWPAPAQSADGPLPAFSATPTGDSNDSRSDDAQDVSSSPVDGHSAHNKADMITKAPAFEEGSSASLQEYQTPPSLSHHLPYQIVHTSKLGKKTALRDDSEPLVDTTAAIPLHSKKTERIQKRLQRKSKQPKPRTEPNLLLDLPSELLFEVITCLQPSDVLRLSQMNRAIHDFLTLNETTIAKDIIRRRYWVLSRCLPLPVSLESVDSSAHPALLSERRQAMVNHHRKPYQHVRHIDETRVCTCMSCVLGWNILCMVLDLSHWQKGFANREPIPMIQRGRKPEWNEALLDKHAAAVYKAMCSPLAYAVILEKHLATTTGTILRRSKWAKKPVTPASRLYRLSLAEAAQATDEYLERSGPPSHEFPYHRDNYYNLEAYVPNRIWSKDEQRWKYYASGLHDRDVEWVKARFTPAPPVDREKEEAEAKAKDWYSGSFDLATLTLASAS